MSPVGDILGPGAVNLKKKTTSNGRENHRTEVLIPQPLTRHLPQKTYMKVILLGHSVVAEATEFRTTFIASKPSRFCNTNEGNERALTKDYQSDAITQAIGNTST
jgi:hypothetical protein